MSMMAFLDVLHLGGGEIAKRVVLRAVVFHESYKFVVLHFQLLFVNRPLSALPSRFHFARLPSLHRPDHRLDERDLFLRQFVLLLRRSRIVWIGSCGKPLLLRADRLCNHRLSALFYVPLFNPPLMIWLKSCDRTRSHAQEYRKEFLQISYKIPTVL